MDATRSIEDYASLLATALEPGAAWEDQELGQIMAHQLTVSLIDAFPGVLSAEARNASFGQIFESQAPSVALLQQIKMYAKWCRNAVLAPLPPAVATALYYAAIATALVRCRVRITQLPSSELCDGFHWLMAREWVPARLKLLAVEGMMQLEAASER